MPGDVFVPQYGSQEARQFVLGLYKTSSSRNHRGRQWPCNPCCGKELGNIRGQSEWNWPVGI